MAQRRVAYALYAHRDALFAAAFSSNPELLSNDDATVESMVEKIISLLGNALSIGAAKEIEFLSCLMQLMALCAKDNVYASVTISEIVPWEVKRKSFFLYTLKMVLMIVV